MPIFPFYSNYYNNYYPNYYNNRIFRNSNANAFINNENQEKKEKKVEEEQNGQEKTNKQNEEIPENRNYNDKIEKNKTSNQKRTSKYNSFANINISALLESDLDTPIVEILGIKLYLDDLIIIGLLFFLYKEDVQDEILFGILLLLLLS